MLLIYFISPNRPPQGTYGGVDVILVRCATPESTEQHSLLRGHLIRKRLDAVQKFGAVRHTIFRLFQRIERSRAGIFNNSNL